MTRPQPDPRLDLVLERTVDVQRELVWAAWTTPEYVKQWFTPDPWKTVGCEIDLRPGGLFRTVMRSPEGQEFPNLCCYLEIVKHKKLVWTSALAPGFRPSDQAFGDVPRITAIISLETIAKGTKYTATVLHKDEADRKKHEDMGFHEGWGAATEQLIACVKKMRA